MFMISLNHGSPGIAKTKKRKNLKEYYRISDPNKIEAMIYKSPPA
jgi:hypothetical protein